MEAKAGAQARESDAPRRRPCTFVCCGHELSVRVDFGSIADVREAAQVSLPTLLQASTVDGPPGINLFAEQQPDLWCETVWALVRSQAKELKLPKSAFVEDFMGGQPSDDAIRAVSEAIPLFFRQPAKRRLHEALADLAVAIVDARAADIDKALLERDRRETLNHSTPGNASAGDSPAPSASTPAT